MIIKFNLVRHCISKSYLGDSIPPGNEQVAYLQGKRWMLLRRLPRVWFWDSGGDIYIGRI